jgi:OPA family glycerol-3-phosphate transporter-like MFS transporter
MPVEEYDEEPSENDNAKDREKELSAKEIFFKYVLNNKYVWFLALANIFVYFIRYGIEDWAPTYLSTVKGVKVSHSGISFVVYETAGILGMLLCGYISDKWFKKKRAVVNISCMVLIIPCLLVYWFSPSIFVIHAALFAMGMFIYGPVVLLTVQAAEIVHKKAVGTAVGLLGFFGYIFGTTAASLGFGYIVQYLGWYGGFVALFLSSVFAIFFLVLTLGAKSVVKKSVAELEPEMVEEEPVLEN